MKKILVIGCPGAGKSTFSKALRGKLGLPLFHLDMLFWKADKTTLSREEFDQKLGEILAVDSWIIDGNYGRTLHRRLEVCDTVFLLDLPVEVCLEGAINRIGKLRDDLPWRETELDPEFRDWISDFPNKELPQVYETLEKHKDKSIVVFHSHEEINAYLEEL